MFQKVLVPVDLTDRHQPALDIAAKLVVPGSGEIRLLHVIEVLAGLPVEEEPTFYQRLERKASAHLNRLLDQLKDRRVPARSIILVGQRIPQILRDAQQ